MDLSERGFFFFLLLLFQKRGSHQSRDPVLPVIYIEKKYIVIAQLVVIYLRILERVLIFDKVIFFT